MKHLSQLSDEVIIDRIYTVRGLKVMVDKDLAQLYGVETRRLKEQVRRNNRRFPEDFMFILDWDEYRSLRSQNAISEEGRSRYKPMVFTEQGVAMLSSVLNSDHDEQIAVIFDCLKELQQAQEEEENFKRRRRIGFKIQEDS